MANERSIGKFKQALNKLGNFRTKMQDEIIDDVRQKKAEDWMEDKAQRKKEADKNYAWQEAMRKGRGMEVPEPYVEETPDVPEIDTKVVDLPEEDENEKELIVEHNDEEPEETDDTTVAEPIPQEENAELGNFDESEVVEPPTEENAVSGEEVGDIEPETPKEEPKEEKGEEKKEGEKDEEEPVMTDEEALAEAQEMAQDDLVGFKVTGKNWSKMTDKQKAEAIKAFKDKNKVEDHSTDIDNNETNNFESYKRYPTGLRVAEDLVGAGGKVIEGAGDVAKTEIGGTGANMISERAKGVPHYDYTSLFGRR